jgi:hypothetical protein
MCEHGPEVLAHAKRALNFGAEASMAESMANEQKLSGELREARANRANKAKQD